MVSKIGPCRSPSYIVHKLDLNPFKHSLLWPILLWSMADYKLIDEVILKLWYSRMSLMMLFSSTKYYCYFVRIHLKFFCRRSPLLSTLFSSFAALLGTLPIQASSFVVKKTIGKSWSRTASEAACSHLLKVK